MPRTCCEATSQACCFDYRIAFPCNDKVPCACGYCGLVCVYDWIFNVGCCRTLGDIDPKYGPQNKPVRTAVQQVPQQVHMQQQPQQVVYVQQPQQVVYVQQPQPVVLVQQPQIVYAQPQTVVYAQQQPTYR